MNLLYSYGLIEHNDNRKKISAKDFEILLIENIKKFNKENLNVNKIIIYLNN
jgi:hypothetical protein